MSTSAWVDFRAVKAAVGIGQVVRRYGLQLKQHGRELRGRCPFHEGGNPDSLHVNAEKNCFKCFSTRCNARGNVLDFVAAMERCTVREAALKLQGWYGVSAGMEIPERGIVAAPEVVKVVEAEAETAEPNKPLQFALKSVDYGHAYLRERGIDVATAERFGVGYFAGRGTMGGRVVFPIHNRKGELVGYVGRSVDGSEPRYKFPAGFHKSRELFNLHRAVDAAGEGVGHFLFERGGCGFGRVGEDCGFVRVGNGGRVNDVGRRGKAGVGLVELFQLQAYRRVGGERAEAGGRWFRFGRGRRLGG